jgi:hypothetical protein
MKLKCNLAVKMTNKKVSNFWLISLSTLLLLVFPLSIKPQNTKKTSQRAAGIAKTDKGKLQAKKIIEQFIDGVFVERKTLATVKRFMRLDLCDKVDEALVLPIGCSLPKLNRSLGLKTIARISAIAWRYGEGRYALQIGVYPITKSELAYPYSAPNYELLASSTPDYDDLVDEVLKKNGSPEPEIEVFTILNTLGIKKFLLGMERDADQIETLIYDSINKSVFEKNIEIMKSSIEVEKVHKQGRTYYSIYLLNPDVGFILAIRKGSMKIIGLFDSI